jgi:hypothetical protein
MRILTVSLIVAGLLATTGIASADRRHRDRRDRWEPRTSVRWHQPARRVFVAPVVVAPPRVIVRHRVQPRVIVVQPPPPPPVYVVRPAPPPVYVAPAEPDCDHDRRYDSGYYDGDGDGYDDDGYYDSDGDGYDDDGYSSYSTPPQPTVSAGVSFRVGS